MSRTRLFAMWVGCALLVVLVVGFALLMGNSPPGQLKVSLTCTGFTNGFAGATLAEFRVTNASPFAVWRGGGVMMITKPTDGQAGKKTQFGSWSNPIHLPSNASETLLVPAPTNQSAWRIMLVCGRQESNIRRAVRETADDLGLRRMWRRYEDASIWSQWIESNSFPAQHGDAP